MKVDWLVRHADQISMVLIGQNKIDRDSGLSEDSGCTVKSGQICVVSLKCSYHFVYFI